MSPVEFLGHGSATMRLDGPGVTHDYIACGDCGAPLSPYAMGRLQCLTHKTLRRIYNGPKPHTWNKFHYQPDHGTFGSLFLKPEHNS